MTQARNVRNELEGPVSRPALQRNAILQALSNDSATLIAQRGVVMNVPLRHAIYELEQPIHDIYFPLDCVFSVVARMRDGSQIEVGTIGREGMSALPLLMGASSMANFCYCRVSGDAIKIPVGLFNDLRATDAAFGRHLDRYLQDYVNVLAQLAACNRLHSVYERFSRWLLMTRDRVDTDHIPLTQEFLATILGARRSSVAIALGTLQRAGYIKCSHGAITILDRAGLENAACECYALTREQRDGPLCAVPVAAAGSIKALGKRRKRFEEAAAAHFA